MLEKINILENAINTKIPISFEYLKEGKVVGTRIGNPHAVYNFKSKNGEKSIKVHIVQTSGVSDSKNENPFPDFRQFDLENMKNVTLLKDKSIFNVDENYNPNWNGYDEYIAKI